MNTRYEIIEKAIAYLEKSFRRQPELDELARHLSVSPFHLQRIFREWVGISPKRFLQFITIDHARNLLRQSRSLLGTALDSGLSGPGRLHDLFITVDAVTPGEYKEFGQGLQIDYGIHESPFGRCLLAVTGRGICALYFVDDQLLPRRLAELHSAWKNARIEMNQKRTGIMVEQIFSFKPRPLKVLLKGTNFQLKVWEALLHIPPGRVLAYEDIAGLINNPKAVRAVGTALARNPVSYLIPCHRVICKDGRFGHYGGGELRKKALIGWEVSRHSS